MMARPYDILSLLVLEYLRERTRRKVCFFYDVGRSWILWWGVKKGRKGGREERKEVRLCLILYLGVS